MLFELWKKRRRKNSYRSVKIESVDNLKNRQINHKGNKIALERTRENIIYHLHAAEHREINSTKHFYANFHLNKNTHFDLR